MFMDTEKLLAPVWETDEMTDEFITMTENDNDDIAGRLLFMPKDIICVKNACLTETYTGGKDYVIKGRDVTRTANSRMAYFTKEQLYGNGYPEMQHFVRDDGRPSLFSEGTFFHEHQIAVSYTCENTWDGFVPPYQGDKVQIAIDKLKSGKPFSLVLYGDSISAGANASSKMGAKPFLPMWIDLVTDCLKQHYHNLNITMHNPSVGGKCSKWGMENADELVNVHNPDMVILAFGMNGGYTLEVFQSHIKKIMKIIRAKNPECAFLLVATSLPNPILTNEKSPFVQYQAEYKNVLEPLCGADKNAAMVNVTDVHKYLISRKRYIDLTGNNVNHPNDFMVRVYAQVVNATLIQK
mgnify:FL=1